MTLTRAWDLSTCRRSMTWRFFGARTAANSRPHKFLPSAAVHGNAAIATKVPKATASSGLARMPFGAQLETLKRQGYEAIYLDVDTFTVNRRAAEREAAMLGEHGFVWGTNTRIDRIDVALMRHCVSNGCVYMFFGVEPSIPASASPSTSSMAVSQTRGRAPKPTRLRFCVCFTKCVPSNCRAATLSSWGFPKQPCRTAAIG